MQRAVRLVSNIFLVLSSLFVIGFHDILEG